MGVAPPFTAHEKYRQKHLADAQARAYEGVKAIRMDKSFHRSDIGQKGIRRLEQLAQEEK